jgi:hypothetical protein
MISPVRSVFTAALALSSLASSYSTPTDSDTKRQDVELAVGPVANAVSVDPVGVNMRTTVLDGAIIGGYSAVVNGEQIIRVTRSTNDGASWTQIGTVASGPADTRDIDNAFPLALPNGRLLMAFRNHDQQPGNGEYTYYRITICESTDGGVSWAFLTHLVERARNGRNGLWEPYLRIARDGAIQAYYSAENAENDQDNLMKRSTDGGRTWSGNILVSGSAVTARDGMVGVADVGGNTLM